MINISVNSGDSVKFNVVERVIESLNIFNAATSWTDLTGKRTKAFEDAALKFEMAINSAGSQINTYNEERNLKGIAQGGSTPSRFVFIAPSYVSLSAETLVVYTRLIASVLIDAKTEATQELTPEDVLGSAGLSSRVCASEILEKGSCDLKIRTLRESLVEYLKPASADSSDIFDLSSDAGKKQVANTCKKIRVFASDKFKLATMDALLVRWATTYELSHILQTDAELSASISKAAQLSKDELIKICWNDDDKAKLNKFFVAMNYKPI